MFESGCRVIRGVLDESMLRQIARVADNFEDSDDWLTVFSHGDQQDQFRFQCPLSPCQEIVDIEKAIMSVIQPINPKWKVREGSWVFLKSLPGGKRQQPHRDYLHEEIIGITEDSLPCGVIVALQSDTKLATYGWNRLVAEKHEEKIHVMEAGDVIVFRGDTIHSGMEYDEVNIRLHCYLDVEDEEYVENETQLIHFSTYRCPNCLEDFDNKNDRNSHKKRCNNYTCNACSYTTSNKNTLRSHRRNKHKYLVV